jgi:hypothetical protein
MYYQLEVVQMTAKLLHGPASVVGAITSGGTESILLVLRAYVVLLFAVEPHFSIFSRYKERAREERGICHPEL